jgi:hypothetical protein
MGYSFNVAGRSATWPVPQNIISKALDITILMTKKGEGACGDSRILFARGKKHA